MPTSHHVRVKKPFDRYDNAGGVAVLSKSGFDRMTNNPKFRDHVELLATEQDNGDVFDAGGTLVATGAQRKGSPIDALAIHETFLKGGAVDGADREEKKSKTR